MVTIKSLNPATIPATWEAFLEMVLQHEAEFRTARDPSQSITRNTNVSTPAKDPDAMDIGAVRQSSPPEELSQEQRTWWEKKLCFRCGKHPYTKGEKCRNPKYKGFYKLPQASGKTSPKPNAVRVVESEAAAQDAATPLTSEQLRTLLQEAEAKEKHESASVVQESPSVENFEDSDFQHQLI